jgi:hypothetical protein
MNQAELYLATQADALRRGDRGVWQEMAFQLKRMGVDTDPPESFPPLDPTALARIETTMVTMPERAVPEKKRGRPPKPRCEHGKIVGRCLDCEDDAVD